MPINDGGSAFPATWYDRDSMGEIAIRGTEPGMSLRAWLAGMALCGMHARDAFDEGQAEPAQRARLACIDADALIAELEKDDAPTQ
jgi:hypothetical protein